MTNFSVGTVQLVKLHNDYYLMKGDIFGIEIFLSYLWMRATQEEYGTVAMNNSAWYLSMGKFVAYY